MEVFLWSASGQILLDTLASSYPTVIAYIIDTPRSSSPATFMSNMLYACSVLYKASLPMILVCNKTDVKDASFVKKWMTDFEAFQAAVRAEKGSDGEEGMGYMGSLMGSMGLVLEEFYNHLDVQSHYSLEVTIGCCDVVGHRGWDARIFQSNGGEKAGV